MKPTAAVMSQRLEADFRGQVLANSRCVFAPGAVLRFGRELEAEGGRLVSLAGLHRELSAFSGVGRRDGLDGFVTGCYAPRFIRDLEGVSTLVRRTLRGLLAREGGEDHVAAVLGSVRPTRWWLPFGGERYFLTVFAPVYPANSSRSTFGAPACFLFFQPDHAFERRVLDPASWEAHRVEIRENHRRNGQPYDSERVQFVAPLQAGETVRWWEPAPPATRFLEPAARGDAGAELRLLVYVYDRLGSRGEGLGPELPAEVPVELVGDLRRALIREDLLERPRKDAFAGIVHRAWRIFRRSRPVDVPGRERGPSR